MADRVYPRAYRSFARREQDRCPYAGSHDNGPDLNYAAWFDWADEFDRTHEQIICPGCGFYVLWIPRDAGIDHDLRGLDG